MPDTIGSWWRAWGPWAASTWVWAAVLWLAGSGLGGPGAQGADSTPPAGLGLESWPGANYAVAAFQFWLPEQVPHVRGVAVLVPGSNADGRAMTGEAVWREFARRHAFGLAGCFFKDKPHAAMNVEEYARAGEGSGQALLDAISAFAQQSGHPEVAAAPLVLWGHSAGGEFNYEFACWKPDRTLAFVVNKGGYYFTHLAPAAARQVPGLLMIGERDDAFRVQSIQGVFAVNRQAGARWTLAVEPGAGHEVGGTRDLAQAFFDAVIPLRLSAAAGETGANAALSALVPTPAWVGDLATLAIQPAATLHTNRTLTAWLPTESFARRWGRFVARGRPVTEEGQPRGLAPRPTSLKQAVRERFSMGVGISDRIPQRTNDWALLTAQFDCITPENCMKPDAVQGAPGVFRFAEPDAFVAFATAHQLRVVGHCLVWAKDDRTPPWFYRDGTNLASRDLLLQRLKTHIDTVVGRYRGRIATWDVVNEALDDGTNYLRPSGWSRACDEEFIFKAFEYAHAADPQARLIYNDYNNELPGKREKLVRLVRSLRERQTPVHAIGLQGHYEIDRIPFADIEATLAAMRELGVKVVVSELDLDVVPRSAWWADGGRQREELAKLDPYREGCPPEVLERQAAQYARLFRLFAAYADVIARVSFWNLHDGQSWLNDFPWRRVNHPLLFDRDGRPKPAFAAVLEALTAGPW